MRAFLAIAFIGVAAASAASSPMIGNGYGAREAPRDIDPARLGQLFCESRVAGDMSALTSYFAPKLKSVLDGVPAGEVPWQSRNSAPTGCTVEIVNGYADTIGVLVKVTYVSPAGGWSDTLNLERAPATWLLNNVFYEGGGNLRFRLFEH